MAVNNMKKYILRKVKLRQDEYKNDHDLIVSEYQREEELHKSYRGREILELLQNADDELSNDQPKEIKIVFDGKSLKFSNYGTPFDEKGMASLMYSNNSGKKSRKKKVIGNKGTGFRAILGWATEIRIDSGDLHVKFSSKHAQKVLKEIVFEGEEIPKHLKAATLVFPEWIEDEYKSAYTTEITVSIKKNEKVAENIREQLLSLNENLLLFLNQTEKISINVDDKEILFEKIIENDNTVILSTTVNGEKVYEKRWFLNKRAGKYEDEEYGIIIAYDEELSMPKEPYVYTYFRTDVNFPFPVLLHADFNLNGDRNHLVKNDPANEKILEDVASLLVDTSVRIYDGVSYDRIKFLIPNGSFSEELQRYDFQKVLYAKMKEAEIFPTVNKKYVSYSKDLRFFTSYLAKWLTGKSFEDLLMCSDDTKVDNLLTMTFDIQKYSYEEATRKISAWVKDKKPTEENMRKIAYTAIQFVETFSWYLQMNLYNATYPAFFYNTEGKLITNGNSIFLLDSEYQVTKPPTFANIEFMHPYMRNYLTKKLKQEWHDSDDNAIVHKLRDLNVRQYTAKELISHITDALNSRILNGKEKEAVDRWKTTIKWLWANRNLLFKEDRSLSVLLLTRSGNLTEAYDLYYGSEYGNSLIDDLLENVEDSNEEIVADIRPFIGEEATEEELVNFLKLFNVAKFPRRKETNKRYYGTNASSTQDNGYGKFVLMQAGYPLTLNNKDVFYSVDELCKAVWDNRITCTCIDHLDEILEKASTQSILKWIEVDERLKNVLYNRVDDVFYGDAVSILWGELRTPRPIAQIKKPYSYIYHKFAYVPWITVQDRRYSLQDCILSMDNKKLNLPDYLVVPDYATYASYEKTGVAKKRREYQTIFEKLGVKRDFAELSIDKIYSVLLNLPDIEGSESVAKSLYNSLIDNNSRDYKKELGGVNYHRFLKSGKILTNHGFKDISESYYLSGRDLCEKVAQSYNLIVVPKRRNKKRIKAVLGIDVLRLSGEIIGEPNKHPDDEYFQGDFKTFKMMAFAYRLNIDSKNDRAEARKFSSIAITLCTELKARYTNQATDEIQEIELDNYEYILDGDSHYYVKVPEKIEIYHNVSLASSIANIFGSYLDVDDVVGKYRELYLAGSYEDRELIIQQEFEDEDILSRSAEALNFNEDIEDEFAGIVAKLSEKDIMEIKDSVKGLDFKNLNSIANSPVIIELFKNVGINIEDYNAEAPSIFLDITSYLEREVNNLLPKCEERFKATIYKDLAESPLEDKQYLVDRFLTYNSQKIRVENDVNYEPLDEIYKQLNINSSVKLIDFNELYNQNLNKLKKKLRTTEYIETFMYSPINKSLLYYGEYKELCIRYEELCTKMEPEIEEPLDESKNDVGVRVDVYEVKTAKPEEKTSGSKTVSRTHVRTTGFTRNVSNKEMEELGYSGERMVYNHLIEKYEKVIWRSENAQKAQVNPEGRAGEGYDMEYIDEQGNRKYVEVKAAKATKDQGIHFYMSDYEYNFGKKHSDSYEIFYVSGVRTENPQVLVLKDLFTSQGFNKKKYELIAKSEYEIRAESLI